jgi:hypothetical protein
MKIYFTDDIRFDEEKVQKMRYKIECTCLSDIVYQSAVVYDPDYLHSNIKEDLQFLNIINSIPDVNDENYSSDSLHPWIIRLVINRRELYTRDISITHIIETLYDTFEDTIFIQSSSENYKDNPVLHVRFVKDVNVQEPNETEYLLDPKRFIESIEKEMMEGTLLAGTHSLFINL